MNKDRYFDRLQGVVSEGLRSKAVVQVGCGAGSTAAVLLARCGIGELRLVDCDVVEPENLCRTSYTVEQIGDRKVDALAKLIKSANPFVQIESLHEDILGMGPEKTEALLAGADLIIAGTDKFPAQALINVWSQTFNIPAVFIGLHRGGTGGRIVWSIPGLTACYRCVSGTRYSEGSEPTELPSEHASILDAVFVDAVAMRIAIAILDRGNDDRLSQFFDAMALRNEVVIRTHPEHEYTRAVRGYISELYPEQVRQAVEQTESLTTCALDTIWLESERELNCPDCARAHAPMEITR